MVNDCNASPVWGLTGGIGSGKTLVAGIFLDLGAAVIDADQIAREVVMPGSEGLAQIVERFGKDVLASDKSLDRSKLGTIVFEDDSARRSLNDILHPKILALSETRIRNAQLQAPLVVYEAALLIETERYKTFDALLVVTAPISDRIRRICERDGISVSDAQKRIESQLSDAERIQHATHIVRNDGTKREVSVQVKKLFNTAVAATADSESEDAKHSSE